MLEPGLERRRHHAQLFLARSRLNQRTNMAVNRGGTLPGRLFRGIFNLPQTAISESFLRVLDVSTDPLGQLFLDLLQLLVSSARGLGRVPASKYNDVSSICTRDSLHDKKVLDTHQAMTSSRSRISSRGLNTSSLTATADDAVANAGVNVPCSDSPSASSTLRVRRKGTPGS